METIQNIFIDSLNGFSVRYLPLFLFQLVMATLFGHLMQKLVNKKFKSEVVQNGALIAGSIALISSLVKYSLPFSVLGAILIFGFFKKESTKLETLSLVLIGMIGVGCGIGSIVQTIIGVLFIGFVIIFVPIKSE